jgi:hypothetical protein
MVRLRVSDVHLSDGHLSVRIEKTGDRDLQPVTSDLDVELRRWLMQYAVDLGPPGGGRPPVSSRFRTSLLLVSR